MSSRNGKPLSQVVAESYMDGYKDGVDAVLSYLEDNEILPSWSVHVERIQKLKEEEN